MLKAESSLQFSTFIVETTLQRQQRLFYRRIELVRLLAVVLGIGAAPVFIMGFILLIWFHYSLAAILMLGGGIAILSYVTCWFFLAAAKKENSSRKANVGCYFLLCGAFTAILIARLVFGSQPNGLLAGFLIILTLAGILDLDKVATIIVDIVVILIIILVYGIQIIFKFYTPDPLLEIYPVADLFLWLLVAGIVAVGIYVFTNRLHQAVLLANQQSEKLSELLQALVNTNEIGAVLGQELVSVAAELNTTSQQQASSSQEQAVAITQVTGSLTELTVTATQIASSVSAAATAATQTVGIATEVKYNSNQAAAAAVVGNQAAEQVLACVEQVQIGIEQLSRSLARLSEQAQKASSIIDIIDDIAEQTHLLALNAFIEAAGSSLGKDGSAVSVRGDRFGVIAQEVKNLADSSKRAARQVRQTVTQMKNAVAEAVLVADQSSQQAILTVSRSYTATVVIERLAQAISTSATCADQILTATELVQNSGETISMATHQQHTTNEQLLKLMQGVTEVSQQNAQSAIQISETVSRVYQQIDQLNLLLSQTREASVFAIPGGEGV